MIVALPVLMPAALFFTHQLSFTCFHYVTCIIVVAARQAWDLALDHCLAQLPRVIEDNTTFEHSPFFAEQLTAFQVWLAYGSEKRSPPEQLPIVLQVTAYLRFISHMLFTSKMFSVKLCSLLTVSTVYPVALLQECVCETWL